MHLRLAAIERWVMAEEPRSIWDEEPRFIRWDIATWEHAALSKNANPVTDCVRSSKRLLPEEVTAPIYTALLQYEEKILRFTEPTPPLRVRLLRDARDFLTPTEEKAECSYSVNFFKGANSPLDNHISDLVPDWNNIVHEILGDQRPKIETHIRAFANLGIPHQDFSLQYGYRVNLFMIPGRYVGREAETHRSLLIGCNEAILQPGPLRETWDILLSR